MTLAAGVLGLTAMTIFKSADMSDEAEDDRFIELAMPLVGNMRTEDDEENEVDADDLEHKDPLNEGKFAEFT
jgi:hypothetical protein